LDPNSCYSKASREFEGNYLLELSLLESPLLGLDSFAEGLAESDVLFDSLEVSFFPAVVGDAEDPESEAPVFERLSVL
tara:strand:- start:1203 stop:1436 length:234 start_codon:yes stop_codon:yes gene_type:complete